MSKTVDQLIEKGRCIIAGLKDNKEEVEKHNINDELIKKLENLCEQTQIEGDKQEELKAAYHAKTKEVSDLMIDLKQTINQIKNNIKPYYLQSEWIKFGIEDKK